MLRVARVCVCVNHLKRCKTSIADFSVCLFISNRSLFISSGGVQSTVETAPNEAIHLCWKQNLINSVYLLFHLLFYFHSVLPPWQPAKPRTGTLHVDPFRDILPLDLAV